MDGIVKTDGVLGGKARLEGRRISVIDLAERVLDHGQALSPGEFTRGVKRIDKYLSPETMRNHIE